MEHAKNTVHRIHCLLILHCHTLEYIALQETKAVQVVARTHNSYSHKYKSPSNSQTRRLLTSMEIFYQDSLKSLTLLAVLVAPNILVLAHIQQSAADSISRQDLPSASFLSIWLLRHS
ncbi:hypothetical protein AAHE18_13G115100 [Arachis hypogaea]